MVRFPKPEIDRWRNILDTEWKCPKRVSNVGDSPVNYFELPNRVTEGTGLTRVLFRMTGEPDEGYVVGVTENVPEELKDYWAYAEWAEFMKYGLDNPDKTLHAEQDTLSRMPSEIVLDYATTKAQLYSEMLQGVREKGLDYWKFGISDVKGFIRAKSFLEEQIS